MKYNGIDHICMGDNGTAYEMKSLCFKIDLFALMSKSLFANIKSSISEFNETFQNVEAL